MTTHILTLDNDLQYCSYTDHAKAEYWICSPHNGAPLFKCSSDVKHILHLLNTGQYKVKATEVVKQCTTTKNYYKVWMYSIA